MGCIVAFNFLLYFIISSVISLILAHYSIIINLCQTMRVAQMSKIWTSNLRDEIVTLLNKMKILCQKFFFVKQTLFSLLFCYQAWRFHSLPHYYVMLQILKLNNENLKKQRKQWFVGSNPVMAANIAYKSFFSWYLQSLPTFRHANTRTSNNEGHL